jgi:hypothetical protein
MKRRLQAADLTDLKEKLAFGPEWKTSLHPALISILGGLSVSQIITGQRQTTKFVTTSFNGQFFNVSKTA